MAKQLSKEEVLECISGGISETGIPNVYYLDGHEVQKLKDNYLRPIQIGFKPDQPSLRAFQICSWESNRPVPKEEIEKVLGNF